MPGLFIWDKHYTPRECQRNPNILFIFGDNVSRTGYGGQAIIRDESNSFGIPTCKTTKSSFTDKEYDWNCEIINYNLEKLLKESKKYDYIAFPDHGIGTGLAMLKTRAPKTWEYLNKELFRLFNIENDCYVD